MERKIVPELSFLDALLRRGTEALVTRVLYLEATLDEHSEHAMIQVVKLMTIPAKPESPVVIAASECGNFTVNWIQTAKQAQQILLARGVIGSAETSHSK